MLRMTSDKIAADEIAATLRTPEGKALRQVWLSDNIFCLVLAEHHEWATRWRRHPTVNSTGKKYYATRMTRSRRAGRQIKIYMHKEILLMAGKLPPTARHTIGDHQDGESLHNWPDNLEWATPSQNRQNTGGYHAKQMALWRS